MRTSSTCPPGRSVLDGLAAFLAPRAVLFLWDNCEHLADACGAVAEKLLQACPRLSILVTSRQPLGVVGETTWRVPSLSVPDADRSPSDLAEYAAVQLFAERAAATSPAFTLTLERARIVAEVCRRLDGIPLAIKLAAARLNVLTVEQLAARLGDRFRLLVDDGLGRNTVPRHQTLRALVDWSYALLSDSERRLLGRLAVFAGGCTLEAVEAICSEPRLSESDILGVLARLTDRSLVIAEEADGAMRYRLLETVREYALEKLREADEEDLVRDRHMVWFKDLAEQAEIGALGPEQEAWSRRLRLEIANLRAALEWSRAATGDTPRTEVGLVLGGRAVALLGPVGTSEQGTGMVS
ncbi:MAG TPA: hypothetical protein VGL99_13410 [Chloroflexota bacterium]